MMDLCEHTGAMQLDKIVMRRAFGRKVLGQLSPLAPGGKYVEYAVDEGAPGNAAFGRKKLLYQRILLVGQIALIAQTPALVAPTVLLRPHAPSSRIDAHGGTESQAILPTQENSGRALRCLHKETFSVFPDTEAVFLPVHQCSTGASRGVREQRVQSTQMLKYDKEITALLLIDPYNDFISEGGKLWERIRAVAEANNSVPHMLQVL